MRERKNEYQVLKSGFKNYVHVVNGRGAWPGLIARKSRPCRSTAELAHLDHYLMVFRDRPRPVRVGTRGGDCGVEHSCRNTTTPI